MILKADMRTLKFKYDHSYQFLTTPATYRHAFFVQTMEKPLHLIVDDAFEITEGTLFKTFETSGSYLFLLLNPFVQCEESIR
jgi:hypothetical protein